MTAPGCARRSAGGGDRVRPFRPEVSALLGELVPVVRQRLDGMTDRVVDALLDSEPAYRRLVSECDGEPHKTVHVCLERGLTGLVGAGVGSVAGAKEVGR